MKIALAGNPNSGKTTLFNGLTGSNQFVGNWPGVTVEKKEGRLKGNKDVVIADLPGIYSLSPYTLEEVVSRNYLLKESPDAILNIVDGTNLERNLYLTTQLMEMGIPMVIAVNMMDIVRKNKDEIRIDRLSEELGCPVVEISALKGEGIFDAANKAIEAANAGMLPKTPVFSKEAEAVIGEAENLLTGRVEERQRRFLTLKLLEKDEKIWEILPDAPSVAVQIERLEKEFDDDTESIITNERYEYISRLVDGAYKKTGKGQLTVSDKIDRIVTNRWLALPIFAIVMVIVYYVSVTTVGTAMTDWVNDKLFGDGFFLFGQGQAAYEEAMELMEEAIPGDYGTWIPGIPALVGGLMEKLGTSEWLTGLVVDGIVAGVGAVLGFLPQMLVLFAFLAFLEACGYMARVAFIMDRIFRKFGLSGKSFIPMLIGSGCSVPAVMATRTIESDRDRRMTIMTTTFVPCGAKLPIIALIAGALFGGAWWVSPSAYFVGVAAIILSGIFLKKTKMFTGDVAPFVMELPAYHMPTLGNVLRSMWERGWSFIKKAGSVILLSTILVWFTSFFGWVDGEFRMLDALEMNHSILAAIGNSLAWLFIPLGWGDWKSTVAAITGLVAKENVVGTFGILYGFAEVAEDGAEIWTNLREAMTPVAAYSFLVFNLLCAPCFAAIGAIRREMNNAKWFWFAIGYQTILAYLVSMLIYQFGGLLEGKAFGIGTLGAILILIGMLYGLVRKESTKKAG